MAAFVYTRATERIPNAQADLDNLDIRIKLVMANSSAGTDRDAATLSAITTLDGYDGSGYTDLDLGGLSLVRVDALDRTELRCNSGTFGATVAAGTRAIKALVFYVRVDGNPANDWPLAYDDTDPKLATGTFNGDGGPLPYTAPAVGFLHIATA